MTLKASYKTQDEVPEAHRSLYVENEGKFVLDVEGVVPRERVDEFRANNIKLRQQVEEMTTKFGDIDPDKARELLARAAEIEDKKLIKEGDIDGIVSKRTAALLREHQAAVAALTSERDGLTRQLHTHLVHGDVRTAAIQAGVMPAALDDVILRADRIFRAQDGKPAAFNGDEMLYGKDGVTPLRPHEWIATTLRESAPHLFAPSTGSGAAPGASSQGAPGGGGAGLKATNHKDFLANLSKIASGEVQVQFQ